MIVRSANFFGRRQSETTPPLSARSHSNARARRKKILEILFVAGLLAVFISVMIPRFGNRSNIRGKVALFDIQGGIKVALDRYEVSNGSYPGSLQDLVTRPDGAEHWVGPYYVGLPMDPWGRPYVYVFPDRHNPKGYDLYSVGPDGRDGTADDIGNWRAK